MLNSISPGGPTSYFAYEYAQPFQPLGQPVHAIQPPAAPETSCPWKIPTPMHTTSLLPPAPQVQYIVGSPQGGLRRSQSFYAPFDEKYQNVKVEQLSRHGKPHARRSTHPTRKQSKYGLYPSHTMSAPAIPFPEPQYYPPSGYSPPPPYPGGPGYGISADEISLQPEHCSFLVDAVKEMDLCSRIFSTWLEQLDRVDLGKKDKVEINIVSMITTLADDAVKMLTASRNLLSSYKALARLMDRRLSTLASSAQGGDLFAPSHSPPQAQAHDDFQTLALDVHVHSAEISACVEKMQDGLHGLHDAVLRTHEKYSFRKKFWGWMCRVFRFIAQGLFLGGAATALMHPLGVVGTAAMHVGSGLATVVASVCEKIKEGASVPDFYQTYDDEEKGLNEVMKLLQGNIPKSMRVAQTALEKFQAAHIVFRQHQRVAQGRASGYIAPAEAARARGSWRKARNLLELKDETMIQLNVDSISW